MDSYIPSSFRRRRSAHGLTQNTPTNKHLFISCCHIMSATVDRIKINQDVKKMRSKCGNRCPRRWKVQKHQWNVMTYNATKMQSQNATVEALKGQGLLYSRLVVNTFPHRPVDPDPRVSEQLRATWDSLANLSPTTEPVAQVESVAWWPNAF